MKIRRFTPKQTFQWIGCGLRFWKRKPMPWLLAGLLLSILSLAVLQIPFIGVFFLAFLLPVVYASMFDTLTAQLDPSTGKVSNKASSTLFPVSALVGAIVTEQGALVLFIPGTIAILTALVMQFLFSAIGGPFTSISASVFDIGALNLLRLFGAYLLAYVVYILLMANYFYVVPMCLRDDVSVKTALIGGVGIARKNLLVVSLFLATLFSPLLAGIVLIHSLPVVGIAVWIVAGTVVFPLTVHCAYCGNRLTFVNQSR
jgi:hypothetical protein